MGLGIPPLKITEIHNVSTQIGRTQLLSYKLVVSSHPVQFGNDLIT